MTTYKVAQSAVTQLLEDVRREHIAIPELQRPFVWDSVKVRDLMDSLYQGFPIGYLIAWKNPNVRLKDGTKLSVSRARRMRKRLSGRNGRHLGSRNTPVWASITKALPVCAQCIKETHRLLAGFQIAEWFRLQAQVKVPP